LVGFRSNVYRVEIPENSVLNGLVGIHVPTWYISILTLLTAGTYSLLCAALGKALQQTFFDVLATIITICVIFLWGLVATRTAIEGWKGEIFYAPCLASVGDPPPPPMEMNAERRQNVENANSVVT